MLVQRSVLRRSLVLPVIFFFNDTATTEIYTLSLHDALPIFAATLQRAACIDRVRASFLQWRVVQKCVWPRAQEDRKSTRLNSSHSQISYAVFCLKKKTNSVH